MAATALRGAKLPGDKPALGAPLTQRELTLLDVLVKGGCPSNKEIASQLGLTFGTVKMYICNIRAKLGVSNRVELYNRELRKERFADELARVLSIPTEQVPLHRALRDLLASNSTDRQIVELILSK